MPLLRNFTLLLGYGEVERQAAGGVQQGSGAPEEPQHGQAVPGNGTTDQQQVCAIIDGQARAHERLHIKIEGGNFCEFCIHYLPHSPATSVP